MGSRLRRFERRCTWIGICRKAFWEHDFWFGFAWVVADPGNRILDHDYGDGWNGKGKYYPVEWHKFVGHVGYKTRTDLERLKITENPGLDLVNKYWELMTCDSPEKRQKAAINWLKWDSLGAFVGIDNPSSPATSMQGKKTSTTSDELLTSDEDIVKLGLSFYRSLNSRESEINSKNFLEAAVAKN